MFNRTTAWILVAALAAGLGLLAAWQLFGRGGETKAPQLEAVTLLPQPRELPAFNLRQSDGTPLVAGELAGHWTLVFLGFTFCPDVCPTTLAELAQAQKQWESMPESTRPRVLFVSVDPERDTPGKTGEYAHAFHPDTLAATAPVPQLEAFARSLSLVFMKAPGPSGDPDDYSIDHSAGLVVLDPQARMAGVAQQPLDVKSIAADMASLTKAVR